MKKDIATVKQYYESGVEAEWERLNTHRAEFEITCSYLDRFIKPGDTVLDVGGGPGRYSLYLASKGCDVTLLDLSRGNVDFALEKAKAAGLKITGICGDARYADKIITNTFDHVLIMGPLYHLIEVKDRERAVSACLKLLKDDGILYASFISSFAGVIYYLKEGTDIKQIPENELEYMYNAAEGRDYAGQAFTLAYFAKMEDIGTFFDRFGLIRLHFFGQEGIIAPCEDKVYSQSEEAVKEWIEIYKLLCENPNYMSYSEHFMYIGKKEKSKCIT